LAKKRYSALFWTKADKPDKLDAKGIETVRRDFCPLLSRTLKHILDIIMKEKNVDKAVEFAKQVVADLYAGRIDLSELVMCKQLSRKLLNAEVEEKYFGEKMECHTEEELKLLEKRYSNAYYMKSKQAHVELAKKKFRRDPNTAPGVGTRVQYVVICGEGTVSDRAEDPIFVHQKGLPVDIKYYIEQQLTEPFGRIFNPLKEGLNNQIFNGSHTNQRLQQRPREAIAGTLFAHTYTRAKCLHCACVLQHEDECDSCELKNRLFQQRKQEAVDQKRMAADLEDGVSGIVAQVSKKKKKTQGSPKNIKATIKLLAANARRNGLDPETLEMIQKETAVVVDTCDEVKPCINTVTSDGPRNPPPLCRGCATAGHAAETYLKLMQKERELERRFTQLWTQCQRCQGSMFQHIMCSNSECPIFFRRDQAKYDLEDLGKRLERFCAVSRADSQVREPVIHKLYVPVAIEERLKPREIVSVKLEPVTPEETIYDTSSVACPYEEKEEESTYSSISHFYPLPPIDEATGMINVDDAINSMLTFAANVVQ
jgi:hypothetical protein